VPIPVNITRAHIERAMLEIDAMASIPPRRNSRKYHVEHNGKKYPPKYVISIANKYPNREELDPNPSVFTTYMAQDYLKDKGFLCIPLR